MALWSILISSYLIGFSGAMMPGPMLGVTIDASLRIGWTAGPLTVLGHGILEFILIIIMTFGLKDILSNPTVAGFIGIFGGAYLAWMGYGMVMSGVKKTVTLENEGGSDLAAKSPVLLGALVSLTNPYFILWWASTGIESVRRCYTLGLGGVLAFFLGHIMSDFTWYTGVSVALSRGKKMISEKIYHRIMISLGVFLMAFSVYFISSGWTMLPI